jgi:hypothetical protein
MEPGTPQRYVSILEKKSEILTPLGSDNMFASSKRVEAVKFLII